MRHGQLGADEAPPIWTGLIMLALGIWLIAAPSALDYGRITPAVVANGALGVLIAGSAAWSMAAEGRLAMGFSWMTACAGILVAAAPFVLGYSTYSAQQAPYARGDDAATVAMFNDLCVGLTVAALAVLRVFELRVRRYA
jgi:hypothetical protein